jgi:thiol-disulfide isomerase/thioredoxin
MQPSRCASWALAVLIGPSIALAGNPQSADTLFGLKKAQEAALAELKASERPGTSAADQQNAAERFRKLCTELGRRALAIAQKDPDAPDAPEVVVWAYNASKASEDTALVDAAYDMMAERYLDSDTILPVCRLAWDDYLMTARAESFLRAAIGRSRNVNVRGLCCFSLGRHQHELARLARDVKDPVRREIIAARLGSGVIHRVRTIDPETLEREAESLFARTVKDFGPLQPNGPTFAPLGEQADGMIFQLRHLQVGCKAPDIEGEDIDGKPLKLSDYRGKVVMISFWATWCGPCMGLVPHEKALVDMLKGRPFILLGVNGDEDREKVKKVSAQERVIWRSFWNGRASGGIPVRWGVSQWPTVYVIDHAGVIRDDGLVCMPELFHSSKPTKFIEKLVSAAENAAKMD